MDSFKESFWSTLGKIDEKTTEWKQQLAEKTEELKTDLTKENFDKKTTEFSEKVKSSVQESLISFQEKTEELKFRIFEDDGSQGQPTNVVVIALGITQDGGFPQPGCSLSCCTRARKDNIRKYVTCLAIVDLVTHQRWIIDCTPDFREQYNLLEEIQAACEHPQLSPVSQVMKENEEDGQVSFAAPEDVSSFSILDEEEQDESEGGGNGAAAAFSDPFAFVNHQALTGVLLTHAHIGHYTGLQNLGNEVMNTSEVPVYCMPRMQQFLQSNLPWSALVDNRNIVFKVLKDGEKVVLSPRIAVTPITVPHRDEYSETVGFKIEGTLRSMVYIPDIDSWDSWERTKIEGMLLENDVALLDGTFYEELEVARQEKVPHPLIKSTIALLHSLPEYQRRKVKFTHLNHTNPALRVTSDQSKFIHEQGFSVLRQGQKFFL